MVASYVTTRSEGPGNTKVGYYAIIGDTGWAFPGCLLFLVFGK